MKNNAKPPVQRRTGLIISAAVIAVILIAGTLYFENIKNSYKKNIDKIEGTYLTLSKNAAAMKETKKQRVDFYKRRFYIDFPLRYAYAAADFIRKASLVAVDTIELMKIELKPAGQNFTFLLVGRIKAGDKYEARYRFREFYRNLKQLDEILHIDSAKVYVNSTPELYFAVYGEAEPE